MTNESTPPGARSNWLARSSGTAALGLVLALLSPVQATDAPAAANKKPVQTLIEHGLLAMRTDPEASKRDADSALELLKRTPDPDLEIRARMLLCDYLSERDSAAAQQEIVAATALLPRARRQGLRAGVLDCQGQIFETGGDNAKAMVQYQQAVSIASREHDDEMLAQSLFSRGYLLGVQGDYATGLSELRHADALFEKIKKPLHALTTLNGIAILYNRMGDYVQARHIYTRALSAQREAGLQREQAVTLHNLGRVDENLQDWDAAREAFTGSLQISRRINYPRGEAYGLRGLAAVENAVGNPQGALETLKSAEALQRQTPDARLRAQIQLARGVAFHKLQRLPESTAALEDALGVFRQADAVGELNATYSELAAVYAETGNWHSAYERQTDAKVASDKLLKNQLDQRFAALKVEFDTAAQEKENAALMLQNAANRRALAQAHSVRRLQATVILLAVMLVLLLAVLAVFQHRSTLRMRMLAMTDELTGVPNRRAVLNRLDPLLRRGDSPPCSTLIIDIDHFKAINDQHGHPAGDEVLKVVAVTVREAVRGSAFFGRLGGEEFLIALPDTGLEEARAVAESFRERIESIDTARWFADRHRITASIGVAVSVPGKDTPSTMLQRADLALYAAKRSGRNCVKTEPTPESDMAAAAVLGA
jgi:diguanylate cyclase (GGDEF)-like protein